MNKKNSIIILLAVVIFGALMFWGGTKWEAKKLTAQFANQKTAALAQRPQNPNQNQTRPDIAAGEITAVGSADFTIKTNDGSTKKVLFSDSTTERQMTVTKVSGLQVGQQVSVLGKNNADGTLAAQNIIIRPTAQAAQ